MMWPCSINCTAPCCTAPIVLQRVQLYREIRVHSRLQHQNIVQFYAAFLVRVVGVEGGGRWEVG